MHLMELAATKYCGQKDKWTWRFITIRTIKMKQKKKGSFFKKQKEKVLGVPAVA